MRSCWLVLAGIALTTLSGCSGGSTGSSSAPPAVHNEWTWVGGSSATDIPGVYGTLGVAAAANMPGARAYSAYGKDAAGNFWLFGGYGIDSGATVFDLNDLWKYSNGQWTWVSGSNHAEQPGVYGTKGVASSMNVPGARTSPLGWVDNSGTFWLFGGTGVDSVGTRGDLNDLWKYSNGQWTWMSGSNIAADEGTSGAYQGAGVYGQKGMPDAANVPGTRFFASSWTDVQGNLWLFGGEGSDSAGTLGVLNDLWEYSNGVWTWKAGSNLINQFGTYGTLGTAAVANTPGARALAMTWTDVQGSLWLFGGVGNDIDGTRCRLTGSPCFLSDLWKYSGGEWTWMGGPDQANVVGVYGTQGVAAVGNNPAPRGGSVTWTDSSGNLWLFGGSGVPDYNDLWKYSDGEWTWVSGANQGCQSANYGTEGTPSATNIIGARDGSAGWIDASGNLWVFGGDPNSCTTNHKLNDFWEYQP